MKDNGKTVYSISDATFTACRQLDVFYISNNCPTFIIQVYEDKMSTNPMFTIFRDDLMVRILPITIAFKLNINLNKNIEEYQILFLTNKIF